MSTFFLLDERDDLVRFAGDGFNIGMRMLACINGDQIGQGGLQGGQTGADDDAGRFRRGTERAQRIVQLPLQTLLIERIFVTDLAGARQLEPLAFTAEQLDAKLLLQLHDFARKGGLRDVQQL